MAAEWRLCHESPKVWIVTVTLRWIAAPLLWFVLVPTASAREAWPPAVMTYLEALSAVEEGDPPVSMEALFTAAEAAQDELMQVNPVDQKAWMEALSEEDCAYLVQLLRGLRLARGRDVYAQPDPNFLSELAQRLGRPEDRDFFRVYRASWGANMVPSYLRLTPARAAPCVRFGEGLIPPLYERWRGFRTQYPQAYTSYTAQTIQDLEEAVSLGTCACRGADSVEQELSAFVSRFPDTPVRPAIMARLQELEDDPERRPVQCR